MVFLLFTIFVFGAIWGSFLNCLIWRIYNGDGIWPKSLGGKSPDHSYCPHCHHDIRWYDNLPIISFLFLKGRCRDCQKKISWQYPLVELIAGLLFTFSFLILMPDPSFFLVLKYWLAITVMIIIFVYDWRWYLISNAVVIPALVLFLIINIILGFLPWSILWALIAAVIFFAPQYFLSQGKALGEGDIWLGALLAIMLGRLDLTLAAIFVAYLIGAVASVFLLIFGKKKLKSKLPLGVFLSLGSIISLFFGSQLISWYLNLI
jgi:prepilin signal peptidase PulO-like enzyme (type II secretory pathway)